MGFYLLDATEHEPTGKVQTLMALPGAVLLSDAPDKLAPGRITICVVDNGTFQAAGIAFDQQELEVFKGGRGAYYDTRPRQWLTLPVEEVVKLKPHLAEYLRGERDWRY